MANHLKDNVASYVKSGHTITFDIARVRDRTGRRITPTARWWVSRDNDLEEQRWRWECSCGAHGRWIKPGPGAWPRVRLLQLWYEHVRHQHREYWTRATARASAALR